MTWLPQNLSWLAELVATHLALALPAIVLSLLVSIPLARFALARPTFGHPLLAGLALLYAIPSLPLLIIVPVVLGTGLRSPLNMVLVLSLYGVAILVGSCARAFEAVPHSVAESARAMGMGSLRRFFSVELPLAIPIIMSGLRVVAASTISLVTVGAVVGVQSLGTLFTDGFQRGIIEEVLTGVVATVALAFLIDLAIVGITRLATPWRKYQGAGA
ncbi:MAG: ABC transporter permease subunit [Actinomycetaceae bacterium]|nr:ABC transporter permease subunit [Actinomycetaceae bacterium]